MSLIQSRLKGLRRSGNGQFIALCPAHDDTQPSLSISYGADDRTLLHCHRGCPVEAIIAKLGLQMKDLFPENGKMKSSKQVKGTIAATYDYADFEGNLLYQVIRFEPKDFRQRRPDPVSQGGWIWNLKGVKRVLYRLTEVAIAVAEGRPIFIAEGEKDVENLRNQALTATTNAGGAGKWSREYSRCLRGAHVVILPDHDQPGEDHALCVAHNLEGIAASIKIIHLPGLPAKGDVSDWLAAGGTRDQLLALAEAAPLWAPAEETSPSSTFSAQPIDDRPTIEITVEEHEVNEAAAKALARDSSIFQRGGILVRVVTDGSPAAEGIRRPYAPRIEALPPAILRERMAATARWISIAEGKDGPVEKSARPPTWSTAALHARASWPGVRYLEAIVDYPILRPDGTILDTPGFDPATGLLLRTQGLLATVPEEPTIDDARAACQALFEAVVDFPFEREHHRAAWLAALLTPLARFAFKGPAPLFLVDANVRGAGKGLLLDCISHIATGERFTIATYTNDENELRKRITALALGGDRLVLFDNLNGRFGNGVLDAALTATAWKDRVLGVNRMAEAPLFMTWFATGNNVLIADDTARRTCHIRLESAEERPEERRGFRHPDLYAWLQANRPRLLGGALTILRAYCVAGRPGLGLTPWGSFNAWSRLVRQAVVWLGLPDPGETRLQLQARSDVAAESMGLLLDCWEKMDPERRGLTAAQVIHCLYKQPPTPIPGYHADMKAALEAFLGRPDSRGLGNKLRDYRRRIFQGRYVDQAGTVQRAARWAVFPATAFHNRPEDLHHTHDTHQISLSDRECGEGGECLSAGSTREVIEF